MKILNRYILKEHLAPFFFAFFTITFLLVIDYVPKITDTVINKDLSIWIALKLLGYNLAWMLALSVPMSVLVATLMAFGRLNSDMEITAIKASGINLLRILLPLLVAGSILALFMVEFNDRVLPDLNKKARVLKGDISAMRPTLVFKSKIFISDIPGYLIYINKINHKTSRVDGVQITDTKDNNKPRIIIAQYGYLKMTNHNTNMQFTLYDGEIHSLDINDPENYRKVDFDKQVINVSDPGAVLRYSKDNYRSDREMPIKDMKEKVTQAITLIKPFRKRMFSSLEEKFDYLLADTFTYKNADSLSDSVAYYIVKTSAANFKRSMERTNQQIKFQKLTIDKYKIEIYKKYSIPVAIISFILIGAPLGIFSKGKGMGVAIAISLILFVIYWAFLIGGEDLADRGMVPPFWAMWSANILIGGVGIYLLYIVVTEKKLFSYFRKNK
ncbi:MAG: YjgP/YjgQ family permease [FCB group bacterium]|nr:YjgP/YjgQ family permease [FCB group bacterium]